ncbi:MAG: SCO family protein [Oligoflexia bacterium]|nr:SCO family protein [Oligoflexia bacterium]
MFRHPLAWALSALLVLGLPALVVYWRTPPNLDRFDPLPGFSLTDQQGATLTSLDLRGKVVLIDFIFTRCPDQCPLLTSKAAALQRALPDRPFGGVPIDLVSITVDPAYDKPAVLAEYADRYGADPSRWHFLTGDPDAIHQVITDLQQVADKTGETGGVPKIAHSERFLLIDAQGVVRGFYDSDEDGLQRLRQDALSLARSGGL